MGLDGDQRPVIIEYKRHAHEGHFTQILNYLSWLKDHRGDFRWLTQERLAPKVAASISWSDPRLLCIAGDFPDHASNAVREMHAGIELVRYRHYGDDLLMLERLNPADAPAKQARITDAPSAVPSGGAIGATDTGCLREAPSGLKERKLTPHTAAQLEFWRAFVDCMVAHPSVRCPRPTGETSMRFAAGRDGFQFVSYHSPKQYLTDNVAEELRVELEISSAGASDCYALLEAQRDEIEREVGERVIWRPMLDHKSCFVTISVGCGAMTKADWGAQHEWLRERLELFIGAFRPRISALELPTTT